MPLARVDEPEQRHVNSQDAIDEIDTIVGKLTLGDSPDNASDDEPQLLRILALVSDPQNRDASVRIFRQMLLGLRPTHEWLIPFCMRTLRWPEIADAARELTGAEGSVMPRLARDTLDAYDEQWDGDLIFPHYKR